MPPLATSGDVHAQAVLSESSSIAPLRKIDLHPMWGLLTLSKPLPAIFGVCFRALAVQQLHSAAISDIAHRVSSPRLGLSTSKVRLDSRLKMFPLVQNGDNFIARCSVAAQGVGKS
jgi:hypothetical protein